jgi:hypothetical protein
MLALEEGLSGTERPAGGRIGFVRAQHVAKSEARTRQLVAVELTECTGARGHAAV